MPFALLCKQDPILPCVPQYIAAHHPLVRDVTIHGEAIMVEDLVDLFWETQVIAAEHLQLADT